MAPIRQMAQLEYASVTANRSYGFESRFVMGFYRPFGVRSTPPIASRKSQAARRQDLIIGTECKSYRAQDLNIRPKGRMTWRKFLSLLVGTFQASFPGRVYRISRASLKRVAILSSPSVSWTDVEKNAASRSREGSRVIYERRQGSAPEAGSPVRVLAMREENEVGEACFNYGAR